MNSIHRSVLLNEVIEGLNLDGKSVLVDGTFGGGGHSAEALARYPELRIIAIDQDQSTWERAKEKFSGKRISFHLGNFRDLDRILGEEGVGQVDAVLLDLGLSSDQLENSGRGFSFMKDEPLAMTMKENPSSEDLSALDMVNEWSEESLADIIYGYGEERFARRIACGIAEARREKKIATTGDLVEIIARSVPAAYRRGKPHFATRTFQALRIAVNDELGALERGMEKGFNALAPGGRMAVISFHSLEDRKVKNFYKEKYASGEARVLTKKPITPGDEELKSNPRARSAKLRILEKI